MSDGQPKFLVSASGRKEAVILRLREYRRLLQRIEDLEDSMALDRAEKTSRRLVAYAQVREGLRRAGKL